MEIDSFFADAWRSDGAQPGKAPEWVGDGAAPGVGPQATDTRPRQAAYVVAIIVLALSLAGTVVAYLVSTRSADRWKATAERRAGDLTAVELERDTARRERLEAQAALTSSKDELADTVLRLNEANEQVTTLTAEKAKMLDKATFVPAAVQMATSLAQSISACAMQAQGTAASPVATDAAGGETFAAAVAPAGARPCDQAKTESEAFMRWLGSQ